MRDYINLDTIKFYTFIENMPVKLWQDHIPAKVVITGDILQFAWRSPPGVRQQMGIVHMGWVMKDIWIESSWLFMVLE